MHNVCIQVYIYIYTSVYIIHVYRYLYVRIERERDRDREREMSWPSRVPTHLAEPAEPAEPAVITQNMIMTSDVSSEFVVLRGCR